MKISGMKIAHLILAHKNPEQVAKMIAMLQHFSVDFFIHVDKKVDLSLFDNLIKEKNVFFIKKRVRIEWGGWGTIQATLNGFEIILNKGYDYINVISGQDFPIKSANYIYQFFSEKKGIEFITCDAVGAGWDVASRIEQYHLINWSIPGKFRLGRLLTWLLPKRKFPFEYEIVGRANWFTISNEAGIYLLDFLKYHPEVKDYFKYCWGADEFIFSTVLYNSAFKSNIADNLVFADFNSDQVGHPRILSAVDFETLKSSDKLFARKFDFVAAPQAYDMLKKLISGRL